MVGRLASNTLRTWGRSCTVIWRLGKAFARTKESWPPDPPSYFWREVN